LASGDLPFCPNCGKLLTPSKDEGGVRLVCKVCGFVSDASSFAGAVKVTQRIDHSPQEMTVVVESSSSKTMPTVRASCPKCGHNEAYWWLVQTRRADEGSTRFYRCVKCGYTWREYD